MGAVFNLAQDCNQNFQLFCISINITMLIMNAFATGKMQSLLPAVFDSASRTVFESVCEVHCASLHYFYYQWRCQKRTIRDTAKTLSELREALEHDPKMLTGLLAESCMPQLSPSPGDVETFEFVDFSSDQAIAEANVAAVIGDS